MKRRRETVDVLYLEAFKTKLDGALSNLVEGPHGRGAGPR